MGDDGSFEAWYARAQPRLVRSFALDTGDLALAQDVVAEACAALYRRWERDRPADPDAWAAVAAFHELGARRRSWRRERRNGDVLALAGEAGEPGLVVDVDLALAIRALPPRMRRAVVLRYVADLPEAGVAEAMDLSLGGASALLAQARSQLRSRLHNPRSQRSFVRD